MENDKMVNAKSPLGDLGVVKLLVVRFSALGDVAMTVPVIDSLARRYPGVEISVLTRSGFKAMFRSMPSNVRFRGIDLKDYDGWVGLNRLYRELCAEGYTHVADLHDVLRTKYLRMRFRWGGARVAVIDKGRSEKRRLTRRRHKVFRPLPTSFARYQDTFRRLGFDFDLDFTSIYSAGKPDIAALHSLTGDKAAGRWIGVAPFAKHQGKIYPRERMERVVDRLLQREHTKLFVFGGGKEEKALAEQWQTAYPGVVSVIGALSMEQELALMSHMDVMLSMDSGNMHLASLVGVPVVSVWGATHPFAGFMGWGQTETNAVQVDIPCRPCSVFGQKPCYRGDYACLYSIEEEKIVESIHNITAID